jgi:Fur family ferric uptake transcriptional regulator
MKAMRRSETGSSDQGEYQRLLGALKRAGYRVTAPRRALLRLLAQTREPLSVSEMCEAVNASSAAPPNGNEEPINLVTVYRFANLLVDLKLARRIAFDQGYYRYEREEPQTGAHHHHLVCERCGRVEDFHGCDVADLAARLESESGFVIARHQLEMYGTCPDCRRTGDKSAG